MSHYEVLGCHPASSHDEIKQAYYKSARKYHPDKNNGQDEDFKKIAQAYAVLSDSKKKSQYDLTLPQVTPRDLRVSLDELLIGGERELRFSEEVWIDRNGERARQIVCPQCCHINSFFLCPLCRGSRQVYLDSPIKAWKEQVLRVTIPAKSWPGRTVYSGQTPVVLQLTDLSGCTAYKDGVLYYHHRVGIFRALLGLNEELIIAGEKRHLFHPDPVLPTSEIIIPDAGVYRPNGERGSLSILFEIEFPKDLQPDQRRLLRECLDCEEKKILTS